MRLYTHESNVLGTLRCVNRPVCDPEHPAEGPPGSGPRTAEMKAPLKAPPGPASTTASAEPKLPFQFGDMVGMKFAKKHKHVKVGPRFPVFSLRSAGGLGPAMNAWDHWDGHRILLRTDKQQLLV